MKLKFEILNVWNLEINEVIDEMIYKMKLKFEFLNFWIFEI